MSSHESAFKLELERRMSILESPGYVDPAGEDLPIRDLVSLLLLVVLTVLLSFVVLW
jgi:hypothetical protein